MKSKALYLIAGVAAAVMAVALTVTADSGYSIAHWALAGFMFVWAMLAFAIALTPRGRPRTRGRAP
jgi:hypothetical protein